MNTNILRFWRRREKVASDVLRTPKISAMEASELSADASGEGSRTQHFAVLLYVHPVKVKVYC